MSGFLQVLFVRKKNMGRQSRFRYRVRWTKADIPRLKPPSPVGVYKPGVPVPLKRGEEKRGNRLEISGMEGCKHVLFSVVNNMMYNMFSLRFMVVILLGKLQTPPSVSLAFL